MVDRDRETIRSLAITALQRVFERLPADHPRCTALVLSTTRIDGSEGFSIDGTAREVADAFGIDHAESVNFACSGFSAAVKRALELREQHEHVAVVCSEVATYGLNCEDPSTLVVFGDGAGATSLSEQGAHRIIEPVLAEAFDDPRQAIDAQKGKFLDFDDSRRERMVFRMDGIKTLLAAIRTLTNLIEPEIIARADEHIVIVPHQPSVPVLERFQRELTEKGIHQRVVVDLKDIGNIVSAAVLIALSRNFHSIPQGTTVLCPTVGGGPSLAVGQMSRGMVRFVKG